MSVDTPADNQGRGFRVEAAAAERWPARRVDDEWRDLELVADVHGTDTGALLLEAGTSLEVKSCVATQTCRDSNGRIWIPRDTHERLREDDGDYVVAVVDDGGEILRMAHVRGSYVDVVIGGEWWDCGAGGQTHDQFRQIPWTAFFDSLEDPYGGETA